MQIKLTELEAGLSGVGRMYEKFSTFLRVEVCVNRMKDLGLNKGLENLEAIGATDGIDCLWIGHNDLTN